MDSFVNNDISKQNYNLSRGQGEFLPGSETGRATIGAGV